jgi:hypothetical protein
MRKRIGNTIETPVREVPKFLEGKAFISSEQDSGFIAWRVTPEDLDPLYPIKISLKSLTRRWPLPSSAKAPRE